MYITFRSQRGIGQVAKEMCFGKDISLKFTCLDAREANAKVDYLRGTIKGSVSKDF